MKTKMAAAVLTGLVLSVLMLCAFKLDVVNEDKVMIFNNIEVPAGTKVNGDAVAIFGDLTINGDLTGDAVVIFGDMSVSGTAEGDAVAIFGKISVKGNGIINGDATGIMGGVEKSPNAVIKGEIADLSTPLRIKNHYGIISGVSYGDMIALFVVYAFSCLALLIAPDRIRLMTEASRLKIGRHFSIGILIMILFIPAAVVLSLLFAITLIGIIFIPFIFIAFILVAFFGMIAVEVAIGRRITGHLEGGNSLYIHLMVGVLLVYVLKVIPIFGWLAYFALVVYAVGVAVDTRLGSAKVRSQTAK